MALVKEKVETIQGSDLLIRCLAEQGVDTMFILTGGAVLPVTDAIGRLNEKYGIKYIVTKKEDGAGFAASGYARSSGKVGVVVTTSGPGATNMITPLDNARGDSIPMLFISGQVASYSIGKDAFQEAPVTEITRPITKRSYLVKNINDLPHKLHEAFYISTHGRQGPVHIDFPKDIQQTRTSLENRIYSSPRFDFDSELDDDTINLVIGQIQKSKSPILYVGGGVISSNASEELKKLSELTNIPVTTTLMGLGAFPGTHKNCLGMLGMHGTAYSNFAICGSPLNNYKDGADLVLAIGVRFDDRVTGNPKEFAKNAYIVHVDIDERENGKIKVPDLFVFSDVKKFLQKLNSGVIREQMPDYSTWWEHINTLRQKFPLKYEDWKDEVDREIPTQYVIQTLCRLTKNQDPIVSTGVGQHQMWAAQYFLVDKPRKFLTSGGKGAMGFGFPAAIGAQVANPESLVIDLDGEESFKMAQYELETVARYNLPVKIVIFDNMGHGMVQQWQIANYDGRIVASKFEPIVDLSKIAAAYETSEGRRLIGSKRISKNDEVEPALREMLNFPGPYVLQVDVRYEDCLPMIPAGKSVREIQLT